MIGRIEAFFRKLRHRMSRSEMALRLLGLHKEKGTEAEPGLLLIQIDGLARKQMERAVAKGRMPFLRWLLEREHYHLRTFYSGMPSSTPGVQAELFYGKRSAVPAFSFMDRKTRKVFRMYTQDSASRIEEQLEEECGEGLLAGGSAYCHIYRGGARETHFCAPDLGWDSAMRPPAFWRLVTVIALHFWSVVRLVTLTVIEFLLAIIDFFRGIVQGQDLWKELKFIPTRVGICILLRELVVVGAGMDLARGLPVIHLNLLGYDEQAHRRGPSSAFAHWTLLGIDDAIKRLYRVALRSPNRDYAIWIFSDHGQEETVSFPSVTGKSLAAVVEEIFKEADGKQPRIEGEAGIQASRAAWAGLRRRTRNVPPVPPRVVGEKEVVVAAMGPVGHIYCAGELSDEEKAGWAGVLVAEGEIPLVFYRTAGGTLSGISSEHGEVELPRDGLKILGEQHPLGDEVTADLVSMLSHPDAGDFCVLGWRRYGKPMSFPEENGAHAGPGPNETTGFLMMPGGTPVQQGRGNFVRPAELRGAVLHHLKRERYSPHVRAAVRGQAPAPEGVRVMTYNIHRCLGLDDKISTERIARVIAQQEPDIVALQEVDVGRARSFRVDQAQAIAELLLMKYHFFPAHEIEDEKYGLAVLSHYPMKLVKSGSLPGLEQLPDIEPRGAQWVTIDCGGRKVQLVNTHLGLRGKERRRQVEAILGEEWLGSLGEDEPLVICGDLNALPQSFVHRRIATQFSDVQDTLLNHRPLRTFYGRYPLGRIDHIFISSHLEPKGVRVPRTSLTRVASDHLPLCAELKLKETGAQEGKTPAGDDAQSLKGERPV